MVLRGENGVGALLVWISRGILFRSTAGVILRIGHSDNTNFQLYGLSRNKHQFKSSTFDKYVESQLGFATL